MMRRLYSETRSYFLALKLPVLETERLRNEREMGRAFLVLALLSHAYVWGAKGEPVLDVLPQNLAKPWLRVSCHLGLRPISCHSALVYFNWKLLDPQGPVDLRYLINYNILHFPTMLKICTVIFDDYVNDDYLFDNTVIIYNYLCCDEHCHIINLSRCNRSYQ